MKWLLTLTLLPALTLTVCGQRLPKKSAADTGAAKKTATAAADRAPATLVNGTALTVSGMFAPKKLRAYGTVSGTSWRGADGGTLLQINCESEEKAKLTQAKYLSDLDSLPPGTKPGTVSVGGQTVNFRDAGAQGAVAALQRGGTVVVAASASAAALGDLLGKALTLGDGWSSSAAVPVPMWLDRFDKYGFHFYYGPGWLKLGPDGIHGDPAYDQAQDFEFAAANRRAGVTIWTGAQYGHSAEWLTNDVGWEWVLRSAVNKGLPVGMNLDLTAKTHFWVYNREPLTMMQFAPGFLGSYYGSMRWGGETVSWCAEEAQDTLFAQLQQIVRKTRGIENISAWLEPHGEMGHGPADYLVEHGPLADANYREYLRDKYQTVAALAARWDLPLRSWADVRVPEVAEFFGWGPDARDLQGEWRASYEAADNDAALAADFDDRAWPTIVAPDHGLARLAGTIAPKPVLWRRHFDADSGWRSAHKKIWLYVWDLNDVRAAARNKDLSQRVVVALNGKALEAAIPLFDESHRGAYDVTALLKDSGNTLALRLPRGMMNYRIYLSGEAPQNYPLLGAAKNARWADFYHWMFHIRGQVVRRGMQMIRQADPDRGIILMSPDSYVDVIQQAAIEFGGDFHNTGYMGGWWCDRLPAHMRAAGLPMSTEPSQGPAIAEHLSFSFGNWLTEGVNAVDLFQHMGEVYWRPDIKQNFEDYINVYSTIGRYHATTAQVAAIYSARVERLPGFPWMNPRTGNGFLAANADGEPLLRGSGFVSGFNSRHLFSPLEGVPPGPIYESDAVTELSFQNNQCDKYRVIVDANTAFMDEATVSGIERFVKHGGVFVTYGDSGRHSYEVPDSWPLARLSGFRAKPGKYFYHDTVSVSAAEEARGFLPAGLDFGTISGAHYQRVEDDAQILAKWKDGSAAVGWRKIGKGYVVTVGPQFDAKRGNPFFHHLFQWLGLAPVPARFEADGENQNVIWRRFISNNGLYDVWVVFNRSQNAELTGAVVMDEPLRPAWFVNLQTGARHAMSDGRLPVRVPAPCIVNVYLTPRTVSGAADEWFALQRGWWSGADGDLGKPFPTPAPLRMVNLTEGWRFKVLDNVELGAGALPPEVAVEFADRDWETRAFDVFTHPDHPGAKRGIFRKAVTIPDDWRGGTIDLRLTHCDGWTRYYMDGQPLADRCMALPVAPGSTHVFAVEVRSEKNERVKLGARESSWMSFYPDPAARQDLAGEWQPSGDYLNWRPAISVPGTTEKNTLALRRVVRLSDEARGRTVCIRGNRMTGVVINGHYLRPHTKEADVLTLNITPWVKFGADNEIILTLGGGPDKITSLTLDFHEPGTYP
ncbi:MAG: hypothetical protein LBK76_01605 [Verrucomicrobiales bacterium]|jgi:hypothetical protein|nr:hypothetical protein [Verrucomicrobiales bacterium]